MGSGASQYKTKEEALAAGVTEEQIAEYLKNKPEAAAKSEDSADESEKTCKADKKAAKKKAKKEEKEAKKAAKKVSFSYPLINSLCKQHKTLECNIQNGKSHNSILSPFAGEKGSPGRQQ